MATNFPIVRLRRAPDEAERLKGRPARFPKQIPYDRQAQRLGQVFAKAESSLATYASDVTVAADPRAVVPERCLVFELLGDVPEFNIAAQALGLEWLATETMTGDAEEVEIDGDVDAEAPERQRPQRLYLTMPTEQALMRLFKQWQLYTSGKAPTREQRGLWQLFGYLHNLRVWSVEDRLDPTLSAYVTKMLEEHPKKDVLVEIDLWYRDDEERRDESLETLDEMLRAVGGERLDLVDIPEIRYQGVLIKVSGAVAQRLVAGEGDIARFRDAMTIRPQSAYESQIDGEGIKFQEEPEEPEFDGDCIAALLDGYPIEQHELLAGRLDVVEVDVTGAQAPALTRQHGTAMASLIVHGDLQAPDTKPLSRPLAVLPVLVSPGGGHKETTPKGKLPIGVVYRALNVIVRATAKTNPELRRVIVINHSICDVYAPFVRRSSPWAALLDYFSHRHHLLFVVSAGNVFSPFPVDFYKTMAAYHAAPENEREAAVLTAIEQAKGLRSIYSPAESINALTIGAVHSDHATPGKGAPPDPYPNFPMSSLVSGLGLGVNRSVKPDFLERGGRFGAGMSNGKDCIQIHALPSVHYGQEVATPSPSGALNRSMLTAGTSNAAALTTRAAHFIADALDELFANDEKPWYELKTRAVMLKTLLAHGASWGDIGALLDDAYPPHDPKKWSPRRNTITQFLGYGQLDVSRVVSGTSNRITLLAQDMIRADQRHEYILPIPASFLNNREVRTVTLTLSWTCPMTHTTADHRAVVLQLVGAKKNTSSFWDGVARTPRAQPNASTSDRGTLIHTVQAGTKKMVDDKGRLVIGVQGISKLGFELQQVPYALAITLEIGQQARSQLYAEVEAQVRSRTRSRTRIVT